MKRFWKALALTAMISGFCAFPTYAVEAPDTDEIPNGIHLEDVSLDGMTYEEAEALIAAKTEALKQVTVTVTFKDPNAVPVEGEEPVKREITITLGELGLKCENPNVLDGIDNIGRYGNLINRYKELKDLKEANLVYDLKFWIDDTLVKDFIDMNAPQFNVEMVNATITREDNQFNLTSSTIGMKVDLEATIAAVMEAVVGYEKTEPIVLEAVAEIIEPAYSYDALASIQYVMGHQYTFYGGTEGRLKNVEKGSSMINGTVILPGEIFSADDAMKPYDAAHGWFPAGSYAAGGVVEQTYGGGICQVSSTLYNAALKAEVGIHTRFNHSMTVGYLPYSLDAAIATGYKDLKLINNYDFPVYIESWTYQYSIHFRIWGAQPGRDVRLESETLKVTPSKITYIDDPTLPEGTEIVEVEGHDGITSIGYKCVYDENGQLIERTQLSKDYYQMSGTTIRRGTMEVPETESSEEETEENETPEAGGEGSEDGTTAGSEDETTGAAGGTEESTEGSSAAPENDPTASAGDDTE